MARPPIQGFFLFGDAIIRENPGLLVFVLAQVASAFLWSGTIVQGLMVLSLFILLAYFLGAYFRVPPMGIRMIRAVDVIVELALVALFLVQRVSETAGLVVVTIYAFTSIPFVFVLMTRDKRVNVIWTLQGILFLAAVFTAMVLTDKRPLAGLAIFLLGAQNVATGLYYDSLLVRRLLPTFTAIAVALLGVVFRMG